MTVKRLPVNNAGRDFVIGDLHGCTGALVDLLDSVHFDGKVDRLFSVGDLIDRGPASADALGLLDQQWFHAVKGNHEEMLCFVVNSPTDQNWDWWTKNGGMWARSEQPWQLRLYADRLETLPLAISVGDGERRFNVLHAEFFGTDADLDAGEFAPHIAQRMLWGRDLINGKAVPPREGLSLTYCGHTPVRSPFCAFSHHYIDTGAGHASPESRLTLIEHGMGEAASVRTWTAPASSLAW